MCAVCAVLDFLCSSTRTEGPQVCDASTHRTRRRADGIELDRHPCCWTARVALPCRLRLALTRRCRWSTPSRRPTPSSGWRTKGKQMRVAQGSWKRAWRRAVASRRGVEHLAERTCGSSSLGYSGSSATLAPQPWHACVEGVQFHPMGRTCGQPNEIKKNAHPQKSTTLFVEGAVIGSAATHAGLNGTVVLLGRSRTSSPC